MEQTAGERTAAAVRAELARRQLSGRDLARRYGWSVATTSRRLNGQTPFTVDEIVAVAEYLQVPVEDLIPRQASQGPDASAVPPRRSPEGPSPVVSA